MAAQPKDAFIPSLTPEQWVGLARLGDLANGAEQFMGGPAGTLPMAMALRAGQWNERFDLDGGIEEILETMKALRKAGAFKLISENAAFVTESLQLLAPLAPKILETLHTLPVTEWLAALHMLGNLLSRVDDVLTFLKGPAGNALVTRLKELGDLWEETSADTTIVEALRLLKQLQEDGNLHRVADISRQIELMTETIDIESLIGSFIELSRNSPLPALVASLMHGGKAMTQALAEATEHEPKDQAGGIAGLYHMLKDPNVQRGIRVLATLPAYLEKAGVLPKRNAG